MSKKHFVLTGIVLTALSVGVASAAPINIVQTGHNIGAEGTTFTNDGHEIWYASFSKRGGWT